MLCAPACEHRRYFHQADRLEPICIAGARSLIAAVTVLCYLRVKKQSIVVTSKALRYVFPMCYLFMLVSANKLTTRQRHVLQYTAPIFIMLYSLCSPAEVQHFRRFHGASDLLWDFHFLCGKSPPGQWLGNLIASLRVFSCRTFSVGRSGEKKK